MHRPSDSKAESELGHELVCAKGSGNFFFKEKRKCYEHFCGQRLVCFCCRGGFRSCVNQRSQYRTEFPFLGDCVCVWLDACTSCLEAKVRGDALAESLGTV